MSQEERDLCLGLTGLSPAERQKRLAEMDERHKKLFAEGQKKLDRRRLVRKLRQTQGPSDPANLDASS